MVFSDKILMRNNHDEEELKYLKKIVSSSQRMQSLINDLLSFSRQSMQSSDFKKTDLNVLVREAMSELEVEIEKSNAQIRFSGLPVIWAIPSLMQQLFYNLINNALKFRKKSVPPVVIIEAEKMRAPEVLQHIKNAPHADYFKISVSDNGIGFDNKYADDIFMVFKRLHSYHEFEGTGMGLSICKKIVEKHSGFITAHGKIDKGSTFVIGLPAKQLQEVET
jgi:light-regulated signal transduction histidine kinase (bacteriophytochrome)